MSDGGRRKAAEFERAASDLEADIAVLDRLAAECLAERQALSADGDDRGPASIVALGMHGYYTLVESALERIERLLAAPPLPGPTWHQELLWGASRPLGDARPAVITTQTAARLDKLRAFRRFIRHAYAVNLDVSELLSTLNHLDSVHPQLHFELAEFARLLRTMATELSD